MIKAFYQEDIIERLAAIITYGLNEGYSYKSIEEHIVSSPLVAKLENNEYDIELKIEKAVETAYGLSLNTQADISFKGLFLAESYIKLFFFYNRSFEYIFLYWPLSYFLERYEIYHEMDFSNLRRDFESKTKETSLLKKLAQERGIKLIEISKLTGINENTIDKYSRDDKYLDGASNSNIYKLARLFDVKENIFISNLEVYFDQSVYLFDKSNKNYRNYLGLYYANYFDNRINERDFVYDEDNNRFESNDGTKLVVVVSELKDQLISKLKEVVDSKTYLVIIPSGFLGENDLFKRLKELDAFDVLVSTQEYIYIAKKNYKKEVTDTVNCSLIIRAKEKANLIVHPMN